MSERDNKAMVHRFYEEVWNEGNLDLVDELLSPAFVNHGAGAEGGSEREAFKQSISKIRTDLNFRHTIEELIAESDTVVARLTGHGEIGKVSPDSGPARERFTGMGAVIWRVRHGQMMERWAFWEPA
jgi:predicted ester cyclase